MPPRVLSWTGVRFSAPPPKTKDPFTNRIWLLGGFSFSAYCQRLASPSGFRRHRRDHSLFGKPATPSLSPRNSPHSYPILRTLVRFVAFFLQPLFGDLANIPPSTCAVTCYIRAVICTSDCVRSPPLNWWRIRNCGKPIWQGTGKFWVPFKLARRQFEAFCERMKEQGKLA